MQQKGGKENRMKSEVTTLQSWLLRNASTKFKGFYKIKRISISLVVFSKFGYFQQHCNPFNISFSFFFFNNKNCNFCRPLLTDFSFER